MVKLKTEMTRPGYAMKQKWRDDRYAVYELTDADTGKFVCLEAFKIRVRKNGPPQSKSEYPRESIPHDEAWGKDGFTIYTMEQAQEKINFMKNKKNNFYGSKKHQ